MRTAVDSAVILRSLAALFLMSLLLVACSSSDSPSFPRATTSITGTVSAPAADSEQFVAVRTDGFASRLASFLFEAVHAEITGLAPVAGATVELVRLSNGTVLQTATTNENGVYTFPEVPALDSGIEYLVRVTGDDATMRAIVIGGVVDISPASEVVTAAVLDSLGGGAVLGNFQLQEVATLNGLLASMEVDVTGMTFADAVQAIRTAAGTVIDNMVSTFSSPGAVDVLRAGDYSVVDFSGGLLDPLIVPQEDALGGIEVGSGQGVMIFNGNRDYPSIGFVSVGKFLHDMEEVINTGGQEAAFPYTVSLAELLHVPNDARQVLIADRTRPSASVAGVGATTGNGTYLIYPLDSTLRVEDAPSIFNMGIRYAARWRPVGAAQPPSVDLSIFDGAGGGGTVYNHVRLQQVLSGELSGSNSIALTTTVGTTTFDSTPQTHDFDEPKSYGSFVSDTVSDTLQIGLGDYAISTGNGSEVLDGLYYIPPNSGLVQFREAAGGALLGWGATSTDGSRDGEILGGQMFSGGFDDPVTSAERSFSISIRQAQDMLTSDLTGTYNLVEYAGYLSNDLTATPPRAFVDTGIRYGTVELNGAGSVSAGALFSKVARYDVAAARGETGSEPNASGASGAFVTANAGDAGETFELIVDGVTVYSKVSAAAGDTVDAQDIQSGLTSALFDLLNAGIEASGSVTDGDLVFTKTSGEPFDIQVINGFTGTSPAPGGFAGADFASGTRTIDNATAAVPTTSSPSGVFTTATAGEAGETFSFVVEGVQVLSVEADGPGDTVTAAQIQSAIDDAAGELTDLGITYAGTIAGGDLVFSRADGTDFTVNVSNGFTGLGGTAGGFAGASFLTGTRTIDNGGEAVDAVPSDSESSGAFTTATAGAAGETFSFSVGGITVYTSGPADGPGADVTAADIDGGLAAVAATLEDAKFTVTGSVAGGNLRFVRDDGADFQIVVNNGYTGIDGEAGGFDLGDFATGTRSINNGSEAVDAVDSDSGLLGAFADATSGDAGEEFRFSVGGRLIYEAPLTTGPGETVTAADVQGGLDVVAATLVAEDGFTIFGSVTGGDLQFTRADGASFDIEIVNTFATQGGFGNVPTGVTSVTNGTQAQAAQPNSSGSSGAFATARAISGGQAYSLTIGGIEVYSAPPSSPGSTVTAADVQGGLDAATDALQDAGFTLSGSATGGNLVVSRNDGAAFEIAVVNTFTDTNLPAGGFAAANFIGTAIIDNGTEASDATASSSGSSGAFATARAVSGDQTYSLTVGGIAVYTSPPSSPGSTVTAADVQGGLDAATSALQDAGFTLSGSVTGGNLVVSREDGAAFQIAIVNTFTDTNLPAGGFAGADFSGGAKLINNGTEIGQNATAPSGAFETGVAGAADETYSLTIGGIPVLNFTSTGVGDTVTDTAVQFALDAAAAELEAAGYTITGTVTGGDLVIARADGAPFQIVVTNGLTGTVSAKGGFQGADFAEGTQTVDNGAVAGPAPSLSAQSGEQVLTFGSYAVSQNGGVTMNLTIGDETIAAEGAVTQDGDFIALATSSTTGGPSPRPGRGLLFLVRQPD